MNTPKLLPSLMCVDFSRMAQTLEVFEQCGIDALHVDIMDGEFVRWARISAGSCAS